MRKECFFYIKENNIDGEVMVVDNNSNDNSFEIARNAGAKVILCPQKGLGRSVRLGVNQANGKYVIIVECNNCYDISNLNIYIQKLRLGAQVVVGNRLLIPKEMETMSGYYKKVVLPILSFLEKIKYSITFRDLQCGLIGIEKESFQKLHCKSKGIEVIMEMVEKATNLGYKIEEAPLNSYKDKRLHANKKNP